MPRKSTTTRTKAKTDTKTTTKTSRRRKKSSASSECTITAAPKGLLANLNLLSSAISSNVEAKDRLTIEIVKGQGRFIAGRDLRLVIPFSASSIIDGKVSIGCRQLKSLTATLDPKSHSLTLLEDKLVITNSKQTYRTELPVYDEELAPIQTEYTEIAKIDGKKFSSILSAIFSFADSDNKKITSGILLELNLEQQPQLLLTGASEAAIARGSLNVVEVESNDNLNLDELKLRVVVPKKALQFVASNASSSSNLVLSVSEDNSLVRFVWGKSVECTVATLKGDYPNIDPILEAAEDNDLSLKFNRDELLAAVKRSQVMSADLTFKIEGDVCQLSHANSTSSSAENIYCAWDDSSSPLKLDFNTDILRKTIEAQGQEVVELAIDSEADPQSPSRVLLDCDELKFLIVQQIDEEEAEEEEEEEETEI